MENVKSSIKTPSNTEREFEIEVPRKNFQKLFDEKVKKYSKELKLNGYRQGAIPKRIVAERFREPLVSETLEKLVDDVVREVCQEHKIEPVAPGQVNDLKNEGDSPITMNVVVEIDQDIDFSNYQDLGIKYEDPGKLKSNELDEEIEKYQKNIATEDPITEKGSEGDILEGEYVSITIDGEEKPLGDNKTFKVEIGADKLKEFNEAFKGAKAGDEKTIEVNYPKDYSVPDLAGKSGKYLVKVLNVSRLNLPELNDEFAKKLGSQSMDQLKEMIKENLEKNRIQNSKQKAHREALEKVMENHPFDIPKARIKQFIEYQNKNNQHVHEDDPEVQKEAVFQLKRYRIIEEVSKKEKIKAVQTEVDVKVEELAKQYGMEFETLKASLRKSGKINDIRQEIKTEKTLDFLAGLKE